MQTLKRLTALLLGAILLVGALAGCSGEKDDAGPYTYVYFTENAPATLDPGVPQYDSDTVQYLGLLYEGLFKMNSNGKLQKALCDDYYTKEINGETKLYIELKDTSWSDGVSVTASNIVYAWKRLLEPDYEGPGASLLFCLKNAVAVKEGVQKMMTIDDIGLVELNEKLLEITFEDPDYDVDLFLRNLASPYLVPVREEIVAANPEGWATSAVEDPTTIVTNGPYCISAWTEDQLVLKRNNYYYLEGIATENKQKYVNPEKITISFGKPADAENTFNATKSGDAENSFLFYLGNFSGENTYKTKDKDVLATTVVYLNTATKVFSKRSVRQGLSAALDRNAIAESVGGKAATGLVPYGVFEAGSASKAFRKVGGNLIGYYTSTEPLNSASGSVTLTIIEGKPEHLAAANAIIDAWKAHGITVKLRQLAYDKYCTVMKTGAYEAIIADLHAYSTDAFSVLAQFAKKYSGRALKQNENYEYGFVAHSTGLKDEEFDTLMEQAFAETNVKARAKLLHQAEELLVDDMVAIPLYFNVDSYVTTEMSGLKTSWYGFKIFNKVKVSDYKTYIEIEENALAEQLEQSIK